MLLTGRRCAIIGSPVAHSLSPVIHRAGYAWLGLDWTYERHDVTADGFPGFVEGLDESWRGLSCTMPVKEAAARYGVPDADVMLTGVANTLVFDPDGGIRSYNTDITGFVAVLERLGLTGLNRAVLLGNGATARSAAVALSRCGTGEIEIRGRNSARVGAFVAWAVDHGLPVVAGEAERPFDPVTNLVVSTVPSDAVDPAKIAPERVSGLVGVFDVIYHPWPTPLATAAATRRAVVANGLDLLVAQAVGQLRLMTGHDVPAEVLASAVRAELDARSES